MRVVIRKLGTHPRQIEHTRDLAHGVVFGHRLLKIKTIEELTLIRIEPTHHRQPPQPLRSAYAITVRSPPQPTSATKSAKSRLMRCNNFIAVGNPEFHSAKQQRRETTAAGVTQ